MLTRSALTIRLHPDDFLVWAREKVLRAEERARLETRVAEAPWLGEVRHA